MSCILPYRQIVIRPDGKISLCCNDPYGTNTMADLNKMSLKEAWYSERYKKVREALRKGRKMSIDVGIVILYLIPKRIKMV